MLVMRCAARINSIRGRMRFGLGAVALLSLLGFATPSQAQMVTYQTNAKGQVVQAVYPDGSVVTYTYDNNGNRLSATVSTGNPPPNAPGAPVVSGIDSTSALVSWAASNSTTGVIGYRYSLDGGVSWTTVGTALSASLPNLTRGATYTVLVEAENAAGFWSAASSRSFATSANSSTPGKSIPFGALLPAIYVALGGRL